jgi:hypothetical protein
MSPDRIEHIVSPYNVFTGVPKNSDNSMNTIDIRFIINLVDCNINLDFFSFLGLGTFRSGYILKYFLLNTSIKRFIFYFGK